MNQLLVTWAAVVGVIAIIAAACRTLRESAPRLHKRPGKVWLLSDDVLQDDKTAFPLEEDQLLAEFNRLEREVSRRTWKTQNDVVRTWVRCGYCGQSFRDHETFMYHLVYHLDCEHR